jgi:hypothetical protein
MFHPDGVASDRMVVHSPSIPEETLLMDDARFYVTFTFGIGITATVWAAICVVYAIGCLSSDDPKKALKLLGLGTLYGVVASFFYGLSWGLSS